MTSKMRIAIFLLIILSPVIAYGETGVEKASGDIVSEEDYISLLEMLDELARQPMNLLTASEQDISQLPWVSPYLAHEIVLLRSRGELERLEDLKKIPGVGAYLIEILRPFVIVKQPVKARRIQTAFVLRMVASPPTLSARGLKAYSRVSLSWKDLEVGMLMEKDKDEKKINDFQTLYVMKRYGRFKIILGDYYPVGGMGLVFSKPYSYSPSMVGDASITPAFGLKPYGSTNENFAFRGVGIEVDEIPLGRVRVRLISGFSRVRLDARIEDGRVVSLPSSGHHRTAGEVATRDALHEDAIALCVQLASGLWHTGFNMYLSSFDQDFDSEAIPWIKGKSNQVASLDFSLRKSGANLSAEGAISNSGGKSGIVSVGIQGEKAEVAVVLRKYGELLRNVHSNPFSSYSDPRGEEGVYLRAVLKPLKIGRLYISNDVHRRVRSGVLSSKGSQTLLRIDLNMQKVDLALSTKITGKQTLTSSSCWESSRRERIRFDVEHRPVRSRGLRLRYERVKSKVGTGTCEVRGKSELVRLDLWASLLNSLTFKAGVYAFSVGSSSSEIYQYETGLPYYPSLEVLKDDGMRWYALLSIESRRFGKLTLKGSCTNYESGEKRRDLRFEYRVRM